MRPATPLLWRILRHDDVTGSSSRHRSGKPLGEVLRERGRETSEYLRTIR